MAKNHSHSHKGSSLTVISTDDEANKKTLGILNINKIIPKSVFIINTLTVF